MSAVTMVEVNFTPGVNMAFSANRDSLYARLMAASKGTFNDHVMAGILATWSCGGGVLPARLGLSPVTFQSMLVHHFGGVSDWEDEWPGCEELSLDRMPERGDLIEMMCEYRAEEDQSELWIAEIIANACMGMDHLWQDMGLWSRKDLSQLMARNFPLLADKNGRDMKWKKFLYKQLCEREGIYVCRAPSCDVCADFVNCFGPED